MAKPLYTPDEYDDLTKEVKKKGHLYKVSYQQEKKKIICKYKEEAQRRPTNFIIIQQSIINIILQSIINSININNRYY